MENEDLEQRERTERHNAHFDGHLESPIVRKVLSQDASFVGEVEDFYDIRTGVTYSNGISFDSRKEDPQKKGKYPESLVGILQDFNEEPFDKNKLKYESVREDSERWGNKGGKEFGLFMGGILTAIGGEIGVLAAYHQHNNLIAGISAGVGLLGMYGLIKGVRGISHPKKTNYELQEYLRLHHTAETADNFMDKFYRTNFIRKQLNENEGRKWKTKQ